MYRCIAAADRGRTVMMDRSIDARSDADAIRIVRDARHPADCEIWCMTRRIAHIPAGGGLPIMPAWR